MNNMIDSIIVKDKKFIKYIDKKQIQERIKALAEQINTDFNGVEPVFLGVLTGSFRFVSDIFKSLKITNQLYFLTIRSYQGTERKDIKEHDLFLPGDLKGKSVIILEDIIDSGYTLEYLLKKLKQFEPKDIKIATLLSKPSGRKVFIQVDYLGFEIDNFFVLGYGLDYDNYGRELNDIYCLTE